MAAVLQNHQILWLPMLHSIPVLLQCSPAQLKTNTLEYQVRILLEESKYSPVLRESVALPETQCHSAAAHRPLKAPERHHR